MNNDWELVIGLEVHAQLKTESKLFSSSPNQFGSDPNSNVNFIDAGMPGMLPVMNSGCIEKAIKTGFALNFQINPYSVFERKNYFSLHHKKKYRRPIHYAKFQKQYSDTNFLKHEHK